MAGGSGKGVALGCVAAGGLLLYSGITNKDILSVVQGLIKGSAPSTAAVNPAGVVPSGASTGASAGTSVTGISTSGVGGSTGGSPAANKILGQFMAAAYGWATGDNWSYLESGWEEESGWSTTAAYDPSDPYNGAYGIPQANPGTKMASAGSNWKTSAATQIAWGLAYIKQTYGSPSQVPLWSANGPLPGYTGY